MDAERGLAREGRVGCGRSPRDGDDFGLSGRRPVVPLQAKLSSSRRATRSPPLDLSLDGGRRNKICPSLAGVVGRKSGSAPDYNYSAALKAANIAWDDSR
jgi:hypothetical protein